MRHLTTLSALLALGVVGCTAPEVDVVFVQINDVYEIGNPDGTASPLARIATLIDELRQDPEVTVVPVLAGDFLSPSALGTATVDGSRLNGAQMVAVLNEMGLEYAAVGNHEFDVDSASFYARLGESRFAWIAANVRETDPSEMVADWDTLRVRTPSGMEIVVGIVGVTLQLPRDEVSYAQIQDPTEAMASALEHLEPLSDFQIGLTHVSAATDRQLAQRFPQLAHIMGGHEHVHMDIGVGPGHPRITKADANAASVWVHRVRYHALDGVTEVESRLILEDSLPAADPETQAVVDDWIKRGFSGFVTAGFDPGEVIATTDVDLEGTEALVRSRPTNLTRLINEAMIRCGGSAQFSLFNSGSVRIDDVLHAGPITQYDAIRILPFGGRIWELTVPGDTLAALLTRGTAPALMNSGAFLQPSAGVTKEGDAWMIDGVPVAGRTWRMAMNDYPAAGRESSLNFGVGVTAGVERVAIGGEMRHALVGQFVQRWPGEDVPEGLATACDVIQR